MPSSPDSRFTRRHRAAFLRILALTSLLTIIAVAPTSPALASPRAPSWWSEIRDPQLQACIQRALKANPELAQAQVRIAQAQTTARELLTPLLPRVDGELALTSGPLRSLGFQFGARQGSQGGQATPADLPLLYVMGSAVVRASLGIDLAGRATLQRKSAQLDIKTQDIAAKNQQEALVLQVVSTYLDASAARAQLAALREQVNTLQALLETTARRLELGERSAVDVLNQKQQLSRVQAQIPLAQLQLEAFLAQLSRLQAQPQGRSYGQSANMDPGPWLTLATGASTHPQDHRSVVIAQRNLKRARMQEQRARRSWAPSLNVSAEAGLQGRYLGEFFSQGFWRMNANLSVPIYQGGRVRTEREKARLQSHQSELALTAAQLDAQRRWSELQSQVRLRKANLRALEHQHQAAKIAADETRKRYLGGTSNYLEVLTALNALTGVELALITARRDLIAAALSLRSFAANSVSSTHGAPGPA